MIGTEFIALRMGPPGSESARLEARANPIATPMAIDTRKEVTTAVTVATAFVHMEPCRTSFTRARATSAGGTSSRRFVTTSESSCHRIRTVRIEIPIRTNAAVRVSSSRNS